ncbi:MAG: formyltransferase [Candidatus Binatia bacterium]
MRSVVFAYHDIGYVCLQELLRTGDTVAAVVTHEDDPNEEVWFRSVRRLAATRGLAVFTPANVNTTAWIERVEGWQPDFIFSFYYRMILPKEMLAIPRRGGLNLHGSLLPRYRGRCPVNWVLIRDEHETGVTLHYMEEKPDRGDIVAQRAVPITDADTARTLFAKLTAAAAELVRDTYPLLRAGTAPRTPQDHTRASYGRARHPEDGRIDWTWAARRIFNLVRAVTHPYPGAFTSWHGRTLYVWAARLLPAAAPSGALPGTIVTVRPALQVQTGSGPIELSRVQLEREAERSGAEWAAAYGVPAGMRLT